MEMVGQELKYVIMVYNTESIIFPYLNGKLGSSKAPTEEFYNLMKKQYNKEDGYTMGIIPENVLSYRSDMRDIMWYIKPQVKQFRFSKGLPYDNGPRKIPYTIFHMKDDQLDVYCTKKKPKAGVKLYAPPYLNIGGTNVCMGNALDDVELSTNYIELMKQVEDAFFNSKFSHTVTGHPPIKKDYSLIAYYRQDVLTTEPLIDLQRKL